MLRSLQVIVLGVFKNPKDLKSLFTLDSVHDGPLVIVEVNAASLKYPRITTGIINMFLFLKRVWPARAARLVFNRVGTEKSKFLR